MLAILLVKSWNLLEDVSIADRTRADWWDLCSGRSQFTPRRLCFALMWVFKRLLMPYSHKQSTNTALRPGDTCNAIEDRKFTENQIGNFQTNRNSICKHIVLLFMFFFCPSSQMQAAVQGEGQGYFLATQARYYLGVQIFAWKPNLTADLVRDWTKMDPTEFNLQYVWSYISTSCKFQEKHKEG